jgi:hypothetical protein
MRGAELPAWPEWCFVPLHAAYAIVSGGGDRRVPYECTHHVGIVGALAAWRIGQQVIRYDSSLYEPMTATAVSGDLPTSLLYRLPVWCPYIETPGLTWEGRPLHGVWVHLDWDDRGEELRFVLDAAESPELSLDPWRGLVPLPLVLGEGSISAALQRVVESGAQQALAHGQTPARATTEIVNEAARALEPLLSLTLYLCSDKPDWSDGCPSNPSPRLTRRRGWRVFAADRPTVWDVGVRLGAALRRAYHAEQVGSGTHAGPRPHIRRAHWHGFWSGPRDSERRFNVRWLPPIAVGIDDLGALPTVVRPVGTAPDGTA